MYLLIDRQWERSLPAGDAVRVVARYPERLLVETAAAPDLPAGAVERVDDENIQVHGVAVPLPAGAYQTEGAPHTLVRFAGPVAQEWREALREAGVEVLFWCPRFGACVRLPGDVPAAQLPVRFPFLLGARPYTEDLCSRQLAEPTGAQRRATGVPEDVLDVVCFARTDRERVAAELRALGIPVLDASSVKLRVRFSGDPRVLRDIVGVKLVDAARGPVPLATTLPQLLGVAAPAGGWDPRYTGRGQVVAVIDTGLDRGRPDTVHGDFRGRVRRVRSWPLNSSWTPYVRAPGADDGAEDRSSGHGTHVAGLAVGSGEESGGRFRGVAPAAELVFEAIEQYTDVLPNHQQAIRPGYYLNGRPLDLRELYRSTAEAGARIHVNAWGDPARGGYTDDCYEADLFLHENPEHVLLFAAGNDGADRDGDAQNEPGSVYAPAAAKNVIAIGATEGGDVGIGMRGTWGALDPRAERYRSALVRGAPVSGAPACLAPCSSTGPTRDGRIRPDVCAPGTNLAAPRSALSLRNGWGLASPLPKYMYNGGTSMSAGVAGGFVALLREAWQEQLGRAPAGTALKALLVLGATPVLRRGAGGPEARESAGFGRIDFRGCAPVQPERAPFVRDGEAVGSGEDRRYALTLTDAGSVRAVLAWYDAPGETLVNDLDLSVRDAAGVLAWGNHAPGERGAPDRRNPIEVVELPALPAGRYEVRVSGSNVPVGPQSFALALSAPAGATLALEDGGAPSDVVPAPPAAPSFAPAPALGLEHLGGLAPAVAARLRAQGIDSLRALLALPPAQLGVRGGVEGRELIALRTRVELLRIAVAAAPTGITAATTVGEALQPGAPPPAGLTSEQWRGALPRLLPLLLLFDVALLEPVRLADLCAVLTHPSP